MKNLAGAFLCLITAAWGNTPGSGSAILGPIAPIVTDNSAFAELRLLTPLTSYATAPGAEFRSVVVAPYRRDGQILLPQGTLVFGTVRRSQAVGLGLVHERASLDIEFHEYELPDGRRFPLIGKLRSIDNARESVTDTGRIKGILAANTPQNLLGGVWRHPKTLSFQHALIGMTGVSGHIWRRCEKSPAIAVALFVIRCTLFRLPEPEIQLPVGTELKLELSGLPEDAPQFANPIERETSEALEEWLKSQPVTVNKPAGGAPGRVAKDIINMAFSGSREELVNAFEAAGWSMPAPLTTRSVSLAYQAFTTQTGYADAPISTLLYHGDEPDFMFQKSLNTLAKRHHIRIWRAEFQGSEIWLGAATHDIAIAFDRKTLRFTHRIFSGIDSERTKVIDDLAMAGCSESSGYVARPGVVSSGDRSSIVTDGRLAVIALRPCAVPGAIDATQIPKAPGSAAVKVARRMILETRQYFLRDNAYYWAYRALRWGVRGAKGPVSFKE